MCERGTIFQDACTATAVGLAQIYV